MNPNPGADPHAHRYRSVLDEDTARARELISQMGSFVETAIQCATTALLDGDRTLAGAVVTGDIALNAMQYELRDLCFTIILTQAPVARDLREVMGIHHMASELERMGDHCVGIGRIDVRRIDDICHGNPSSSAVSFLYVFTWASRGAARTGRGGAGRRT